MKPIRLAELADFFIKWDPTIVVLNAPVDTNGQVISLAPVDLASTGDLSWISVERSQNNASPIHFRGSALVGPYSLKDNAPKVMTILCKDPRLAFAKAVNCLWPETLSFGFPGLGESNSFTSIPKTSFVAAGVVFGSNVRVGENVYIGPNSVICHTSIGDGVRIGANCSIGLEGFGYQKDLDGKYLRFPHVGRIVIQNGVEIGSNVCIDRGALSDTTICTGAKIDNLVHIAHNASVGENSLIIASSMIGGSSSIGANCWIAPGSLIKNNIKIQADVTVGMGAVVLNDIESKDVVAGVPARSISKSKI